MLLPLFAACAPDAWRPDDRDDAFLTQILNKCVFKQVGTLEIIPDYFQMLELFFLDVTSRFYHGKIFRLDCVNFLKAAYTAPPDAPGIPCILGLISK